MSIVNFQRAIFVEARHRDKIVNPERSGNLEPWRIWICDCFKCPTCRNSTLANFHRNVVMEIGKSAFSAENLWEKIEKMKEDGFLVVIEYPL